MVMYKCTGSTLRLKVLSFAPRFNRSPRMLSSGKDNPATVLESLAHTLTNKLMHHPTASLRQSGGREDYVRIARELLGLDGL